ncbi:MAG: hypothetical protein EHM72_03110 [Calditrichaeota bacterium]|nr:MAG: hypothetical protein EHM72_03110 [Calditrichota bacterium]
MISVYLENKASAEQIRYVLRAWAPMIGITWQETDLPQAPEGEALIYYGRTDLGINGLWIQANADENVLPSLIQPRKMRRTNDDPTFPEELWVDFLSTISIEGKPLYRIQENERGVILHNEQRVMVAFDMFALIFALLTRRNELDTPQRDRFGRFQRSFSRLDPALYEYPIVDRYASLLRRLLQLLNPAIQFEPRWPAGYPFAVALSHDVDRIQTWTLHKARRALRSSHARERNLFSRVRLLLGSLMQPENWLGNFGYISELEHRYDAASTFFMVAKSRHKLDPRYRLNSWRMSRAIRLLRHKGWSIQLHGSIPSAKDEAFLHHERSLLQQATGSSVMGIRQHYLCFEEETAAHWQHVGLVYDSTLGFSYDSGYRCGTSFPFRLHDGKKELSVLEIPLILMDTVLFLESKQFLSAEQAWTVIERHLEETRANQGLLTLNWHNSDLHPRDLYGYSQLYERILDWSRRHNGWLTSLDDVYRWWLKK